MLIALPTVAPKPFELTKSPIMNTSDAQFGFKITDIAIFSFKVSAKMYLNTVSPVFVCFLDVKKKKKIGQIT